jgi:hypothetical protein
MGSMRRGLRIFKKLFSPGAATEVVPTISSPAGM